MEDSKNHKRNNSTDSNLFNFDVNRSAAGSEPGASTEGPGPVASYKSQNSLNSIFEKMLGDDEIRPLLFALKKEVQKGAITPFVVRLATLIIAWTFAAKFYFGGAARITEILKELEIIAQNNDWLRIVLGFCTTLVNGPFIAEGGETAAKFVGTGTYKDIKRIIRKDVNLFYGFVTLVSIGTAAFVGYFGSVGQFYQANETVPELVWRALSKLAVLTGNLAGGSTVALLAIKLPVDLLIHWEASRPPRAGYVNIDAPFEVVAPTLKSALLHDLKSLANGLRSLDPNHVKMLFSNRNFRKEFDQLRQSNVAANDHTQYLARAIKMAVMLTAGQTPKSNFDNFKFVSVLFVGSAFSQIGLIGEGYENAPWGGLGQFGAIIAPLSMVLAFAINFAAMYWRLNNLALANMSTIDRAINIALIIPCMLSWASTGAAALDGLFGIGPNAGMFLFFAVIASTAVANYLPGIRNINGFVQSAALAFRNEKITDAELFTRTISGIELILRNFIASLERNKLPESVCLELIQLIGNTVFDFYGFGNIPANDIQPDANSAPMPQNVFRKELTKTSTLAGFDVYLKSPTLVPSQMVAEHQVAKALLTSPSDTAGGPSLS